MIITATQKNIPVSPRKMRMLAATLKDKKPKSAIELLSFLNLRPALPLGKVIKQAIANAVNNHSLPEESLILKEIIVNKGLAYSRWRPASRGRAKSFRRIRSHVTVKLESKLKTPALPKAEPKKTPIVNKVKETASVKKATKSTKKTTKSTIKKAKKA